MDWPEIIEFYLKHPDRAYTLASLVGKKGASYKAPGARMLIADNGSYSGALSAGCLEASIAEMGLCTLQRGRPDLVEIDTRPHYGCYGAIRILLEPLQPSDAREQLCNSIHEALQLRQPLQLETRFEDLEATDFGTQLISAINAGSDCGRLIETLTPRPRIVVIGTWQDGNTLARLTKNLRWDLIQIDPKTYQTKPAAMHRAIPSDSRTAIMIMTHNLGCDVAYLAEALRGGYPYVGVIGSRRRASELIKALGDQNEPELLASLDRLHCPAGLDLGTGGTDVMALSVLAEIQSLFAQRNAAPLRERQKPIHG